MKNDNSLHFYSRRDELSFTSDGLLCFQDRISIPPSLCRKVLSDLHSGHLGVDKMKSLARLTCWWPEIDADIIRIAKSCDKCVHKIHSQSSKWTPWSITCEIWQHIHADYCGPFLDKFYALVVVDSYSRWPEVYLPLIQLHNSHNKLSENCSVVKVSNGLGNR